MSLSPSALNNFLECEHLTVLELEVARGTRDRPHVDNPQGDLIKRKGDEHEAAYLAKLVSDGRDVVTIDVRDPDGRWNAERAAAQTIDAMRTGAEVVYQAVSLDPSGWTGHADFLMRVDTPSALGAHSYEVYDTKLARTAKPYYILQLCFYSEQVARIQGLAPALMHVVLGSGEIASYKPAEFGAYFRRVRRRLEKFVANPPQTEPWPIAHCDICDFKPVCEAHWEEVDHLSRVAGIHRTQIDKLMLGGIATLAALGRAPVEPPPGIPAGTFAKIREQAELQLHARETGRDEYRLLQPQAGAGFALLPEPSTGDLFFDFEGNPFWDKEGSLEYLWGMIDEERNFTPLHAHDRATERAAFGPFIDLVQARLAA